MNVEALVALAMADPTVGNKRIWVIEAMVNIGDPALDEYAVIHEAVKFRAVVVDVVRVKRDNGSPGKAKITLDDCKGGELEDIETDWLEPGSTALHIAGLAKASVGELVEIWKHNQPDPTGRVSHGFRQAVWLRRLPVDASTPGGTSQRGTSAGNGGDANLRRVS